MRYVLICAYAGSFASAVAQNPITAADVSQKLAVGNTVVNISDTMMVSANIGAPGHSSWDFSGLLSHTAITLKSVALATVPTDLLSQFPGATHALKTSLAGSFSGVPGTISGDLYFFVTLGANLLNPGNMGAGTITIPPLNALPGQLQISNSPPDTTYALPSTLGTKWGSTYSATTAVTVGGYPFSSSTKNHALSYVVDAYGTMTMPGGGQFEALRIRKEDNASGKSVGYIFLTKSGASVQLSASDPAAPDSGVIGIERKSVTWTGPFTTDVRTSPGTPAEFLLMQNYPNPFNPSTIIEYRVGTTSHVLLKVYDVLGREVTQLVDDVQQPGIHSVQFSAAHLAGGVYYYTLRTGTFVQTRAMVLVK